MRGWRKSPRRSWSGWHAQTCTHNLSLPLSHTRTLTHSLTHTHTLPLFLSLSHTQTLSLIHTLTVSHSHTHTLSLSHKNLSRPNRPKIRARVNTSSKAMQARVNTRLTTNSSGCLPQSRATSPHSRCGPTGFEHLTQGFLPSSHVGAVASRCGCL